MTIGNATRTPNPSLPFTPAFGGILLSVTEGLVLIRNYAGEIDKKTSRQIRLFTIVPAPVEDADMDGYTERYALRGWNACSVGSSSTQRVIRVEPLYGDRYALLRGALAQMHGPFQLSDSRIAETHRYFDKDPLLMVPIL